MKSGFVTILGRPNAGKSTLLNTLVGQKLAIVTHKPQTTRNRIQGIVNLPARKGRAKAQIVLIDTPGVHKPDSSLDKRMMQEVREALEGCDLILLIADVTQRYGAADQTVAEMVKRAGTPAFLLLNKIDLLKEKHKLLPLIEQRRTDGEFREIIPISARKGDGLDDLLAATVKALPDGPEYFPADQLTDAPLRFLVAEAIREQVLLATEEEVPYATTVLIERFEEEGGLAKIMAVIYCERDGQKAIIIGKGGQMLKRIGTAARHQIESMLGKRVFLELFVKVKPGWRESRSFIEGLDWRRQLEEMATRRESGEASSDAG